MSIEKQAAAALKWTTISKIFAQAVAWVVTLVVIRLLAPEDYGLMALSTVIISVVTNLGELGLGASIIQAKTITKDELANVGGVLLLLNCTLGVLLALAAPLAAAAFDDARLIDVVRVSALVFVFNALATVPQSLAYREMSFKWLSFVDLVTTLVGSFMTLALAWRGFGVWALVLGVLAGALGRTSLLIAHSGFVLPGLALRNVAHHLSFGWRMTITRMAWQLVYQLDILIAGRFLSKEAVGIYSVSLHLANLPMQKVMSVLSQVVFPTVSRMQTDLDKLRVRLLQASRLLSAASVPTLWGISAVAPELVEVLLGQQWAGAVFPLQAVCLVVPLRILSIIFASSVSGVGRVDVDLKNNLVSAIVLPLMFLIGVRWGVDGLAFSWLVAVPLIFLVNFPRIRAVLGIDLRAIGAAVVGPVAAGALMYGAVALARLILTAAPDGSRMIALIAIGALTYLGAVALLDRQVWKDAKRFLALLKA